MFALIILVCSVVYLIYKLTTLNLTYWSERNVPGPKPIPFFGNFLKLALGKEYSAVTTADIYHKFPLDKFVGIYRFQTPILLIRDPEIINYILIKDFSNFQDRGVEFSKEGLGANLFHSDGDTWTVLRKKLSPLFTPAKIKGMFHLIDDKADKFVEYVSNFVDQDYNFHMLCTKYAAEIIGSCVFGIEVDAYNDKHNLFIHKACKPFNPTWRVLLDFMYPGILKKLGWDLFTPDIAKHYEKLVTAIISQREGKSKTRGDLMDLMMELRENKIITASKTSKRNVLDLDVTDAVIIAQAFIFFSAGFDTSASTIAWMLYEMSRNPDVQEKVYEEVKNVLTQYDGNLSYEATLEMKYVDKVMFETLRKYPVIDIARKTINDYQIPGTDFTLTAGTHLIIPSLGLNYDEKLYPDPQKFDPERFSESFNRRVSSLAFGAGPRDCIGSRFAFVLVKTCIARFVSNLKIETCDKTASKYHFEGMRFTLCPEGGIWLKAIKR